MVQQQQQTNLKPIAPKKLASTSPYPVGSPNNPVPVNASKQPKGTVFGAPTGGLPNPIKNRNVSPGKSVPKKTKSAVKKPPKRSKKSPTYQQVQKSVKKTMGYA